MKCLPDSGSISTGHPDCSSTSGRGRAALRPAPGQHGIGRRAAAAILLLSLAARSPHAAAENLLPDPSFENPGPRNRWGQVFPQWGGNVYEGSSRFEIGQVSRTGKHACEMVGAVGGKIRIGSKQVQLEPGRYRVRAYLRGLDLGKGRWGRTIDFSMLFDNQWQAVTLSGTFGWTPVTRVFEVPAAAKPAALYVGLWEEGRLWVDDVSLEPVPPDTPLTPEPVVGAEEAPIDMPGALGPQPRRCSTCAYLNNPAWERCYACGRAVTAQREEYASPAVVVFADFEAGTPAPFGSGTAVTEHASNGRFALRLDRSYTTIETPRNFQDWSEHDYVRFDVFNPQPAPVDLAVEVRDQLTTGYWTRVNLSTVAPSGRSTVTFPAALYVGEKSRPGRMLLRDKITRFVVSVGNNGPVFLDHFRLERLDTDTVTFPELVALDFGPSEAPVMEGFGLAGIATNYSPGRGYGWLETDWWRDFNVLQPDLLYQDFVCPRRGTFRLDLPNGRYHVCLNIDSPGGYWGEVQIYRQRTVTANGRPVVDETMDLERFTRKYFRHAAREDRPGIDTFAEYVEPMFAEKRFTVDVTAGRLELGFRGSGWAICLSALIVYPETRAPDGARFLEWVRTRRRAQFNDYFKQMLPPRAGLEPPADGYRLFRRAPGNPAQAADGPGPGEEIAPGTEVEVSLAGGEEGALLIALQPGARIGRVTLETDTLPTAANGTALPPETLQPGWLDYRISRVKMDGSVYTVTPRYWRQGPAPDAHDVTRNFWVRIKIPANAAPGTYRGRLRFRLETAPPRELSVALRVLPFALDPISDVPVGPFGGGIRSHWFADDEATQNWNRRMFEAALDALNALGCTSFSGHPTGIRVTAADGQIHLDTTVADQEMALIRSKGFRHLIANYGASLQGAYPLYRGVTDQAAKQKGFADAADYRARLWRAIDRHAVENDWVPVAWNLCDEPLGAAIAGAAANAREHAAAGNGLERTFFMGATSMRGADAKDPHHALVSALPIAALNLHDAAAIEVIRRAGGRFAFYNGGNRWTFGRYMKMLVVKHALALRLTWHYNVVAGDPYYALDCREDDYCWFNTNSEGELVPAWRALGQILPGLNDYRYLSTLERLLGEKPDHPNRAAAHRVFTDLMALEPGADRDGKPDFAADRERVVHAILALQE